MTAPHFTAGAHSKTPEYPVLKDFHWSR